MQSVCFLCPYVNDVTVIKGWALQRPPPPGGSTLLFSPRQPVPSMGRVVPWPPSHAHSREATSSQKCPQRSGCGHTPPPPSKTYPPPAAPPQFIRHRSEPFDWVFQFLLLGNTNTKQNKKNKTVLRLKSWRSSKVMIYWKLRRGRRNSLPFWQQQIN